jgi:hypothetical protein
LNTFEPRFEISNIPVLFNDGESGLFMEGTSQYNLYNVYIHDGHQGVINLGTQATFNILNSHFARMGDGTHHNLYIDGEGLTFQYNVSEQSNGHAVKARSHHAFVQCNIILGDYDQVFVTDANESLDFAEGREATAIDNTFGKGNYSHSSDQGMINYSTDREYTSVPEAGYFDIERNIMLNDHTSGSVHDFITIGRFTLCPFEFTGGPSCVSIPNGSGCPGGVCTYFNHPAQSSIVNNKFIGLPTRSTTDQDFNGGSWVMPPINYSGNTESDTRAGAGYAGLSLPVKASDFPIPPACTGRAIGNVAIPP